jgi:Do/DeqQ family serine protease
MRFWRKALMSVVLAAALGAVAQAEEARQVPATRGEALLSFAPLVKTARPAVVNVYASRTDKQQRNPLFDDPIFQQFFGGQRPRTGGPTARSLGSGVIVDASGLVVTNYHVIDNMTDVKVALSDNREIEADIILRDRRSDLAVLKLKGGAPYPVLQLGDSDALEVGDLVLAIGDPFGVGQTVTQGIVSGLARTQVGGSDYQYFIQTDAAINPGNSGGALMDMHARLIGINSAIYSQSGGNVGIGVAIPVNLVKTVIMAAKNGRQEVQRPWLGAALQSVSHDIAESLGLDRTEGALITSVLDGSPAAEAGLKAGDVIKAVDGQPVEDPEGFGYRFATRAIGATTTLSVLREGKPIVVPMATKIAPEVPPREPVTIKNRSPFAGATVVNFSPAVAESMALTGVHEGVVVTEVQPGSNAAMIGLEKGDVILGLDNAKIVSTKQFERGTSANRDYFHLKLSRGGQVLDTEVGG